MLRLGMFYLYDPWMYAHCILCECYTVTYKLTVLKGECSTYDLDLNLLFNRKQRALAVKC